MQKPLVTTPSALSKLSKTPGAMKQQPGEKKETPQERLKRIMAKQLNKQIKKDTAVEMAKKKEQERQRLEKLAETSRLGRYRRRSRSRSYSRSRSPPRRYRRSRSRSRSRSSRRHHSHSRSPSRSRSHSRSRSRSSRRRSRSRYQQRRWNWCLLRYSRIIVYFMFNRQYIRIMYQLLFNQFIFVLPTCTEQSVLQVRKLCHQINQYYSHEIHVCESPNGGEVVLSN